eukprot:CAMPEP_0185030042 /NCGR_PEP_ID=MMETSP1103-20130426/16777_1 /TAXON_ID=36769 /ORGANISM="Paraphysomonas bandaiensis, Strain Caron Lab Isolate" /LENGTH=287 /DNA_ID=CAMNT_0027565009 /DNA_START=303 /DNA_END=1166 /DNA_ORIENTATION=+
MYTEHSVAFIAACIASALNHVHQHGVIHRDVKPENIVLDGRGYPRLIDFGISHSMGAICTARSGTVGYLAPEVLTSSHFHSFESDFWSLGVVVFELLYSTRPFYRHCPKYYVKYSEKNYRPLWESRQLKAMNVLDTPNGVEEERTLCASSKEDSIGLNLPPELEVPVPMILHCGERPSIACLSLIRGLLDVRITHRLGAGNNYIKLQHHHFFCDISWQTLSSRKIKSPLHVDVARVRRILEKTYSGTTDASFSSSADVPPAESNCSCDIQDVLQKYDYYHLSTKCEI